MTIAVLKQRARRLRHSLGTLHNLSISTAQSLELVAKQEGFKDWNVASARHEEVTKGSFPHLDAEQATSTATLPQSLWPNNGEFAAERERLECFLNAVFAIDSQRFQQRKGRDDPQYASEIQWKETIINDINIAEVIHYDCFKQSFGDGPWQYPKEGAKSFQTSFLKIRTADLASPVQLIVDGSTCWTLLFRAGSREFVLPVRCETQSEVKQLAATIIASGYKAHY